MNRKKQISLARTAKDAGTDNFIIIQLAISWVMFGAFFGYILGTSLLPEKYILEFAEVLGLQGKGLNSRLFLTFCGAVVGLIGGVLGGIYVRSDYLKRKKDLELVLAKHGGHYVKDQGSRLATELLYFFPAEEISVHDVIQIPARETDFFVTNVSVTRLSRSRHSTGTHVTTSRTVAYYKPDTIYFPGFILQPSRFLQRLMSPIIGVKGMKFSTHPEFTRYYHLSATNPRTVRKLFDDRLLECLIKFPGYSIKSCNGSLLIWNKRGLSDEKELEKLFNAAGNIIEHMAASARRQKMSKENVMNAGSGVDVAGEEYSGLTRAYLRKLVTCQHLDEFLSRSPPRDIPYNVRAYADQTAPRFYIVIGIALVLFGLAICIANHPFGDVADSSYQDIPILVTGVLVFITGSLFTAASLNSRRHIIRLLRDGRLANASIEKIEPDNNQGQQYASQRMTIMYAAKGLQFQSSCKINSDTVYRANKLIEDQSPARILYDPAHPSRFLYVDAMLNVSPEVEA